MISVTIEAHGVGVTIEVDASYSPDVVDDLTRRATQLVAETAVCDMTGETETEEAEVASGDDDA